MKIMILIDEIPSEDKELVIRKLSKYGDVFFKEDFKKGIISPEAIDIAITPSGRREETRKYLKMMKNLKFLQTLAAGVDNLPFKDIPKHTIVAGNSGANAEEVAEYAISLLLAAVKKIHLNDRTLRRKIWEVHIPRLIKDSKVLIWGYGNIGREIAKRLRMFKCEIYAINRRGKGDEYVDKVFKPANLKEALPYVDYIILVLPLTKETKGIINRKTLSMMKRDAILVNIGRGDLIVEKDLYEHLENNQDFTVAIDVWWRYPKRRGDIYEFKYPFYKLENIIMTPHVAGYWSNFRRKLLHYAVENVIRYLEGKQPHNIVDRTLYT